MSMLPFSSNVSATSAAPSVIRARSAERPTAVDRTPRADSTDDTTRTDKSAREQTPPDFSLLLALLGGTAPKPAPDLATRSLALESVGDDGEADEQFLTVDSESEAEQPQAESDTPTALGDSDQRALARALQSDAMRAARAILVSNNVDNRSLASIEERPSTRDVAGLRGANGRAAELAAALTGGRATDELGNADLLALAERAQGRGRGELMARNDQRAADVRAALDALLDVAGTPRGRVMAETIRPEFASAVARSAESVTTPVRDTAALAPEFRARLDRIVDRMRDEFGHDVQVVETVRSGERQDHLYAQGRTAPGPIVTWTTNSAHEAGEAADVIIDGKWNHPVAYARLHAIAAEEGVKTLGMRDPGHLELRGSANGAHGDESLRDGMREQNPRFSQMGGIAQVASVARVAHVAQVAQVAQVARPGNGVRAAELRPDANAAPLLDNARPTDTASAFGARISDLASQGRARNSDSNGTSDRESRGRSSEGARGMERAATVADAGSAIGTLNASVDRVLDGGVPRVQAPAGSTAAARAEAIAVLREDAPAPSVSSLTMQIDTPTGAEEIRVNLRGGAVGAQVSTNDAALADRLRMQTADLQDALGRHGLETEPLRVNQTARNSEGDAMRQAFADRSEVLKTAGASNGQHMGQHNGQDAGTKERPTAKQQPGREARDEQESTHQQGRRNNWQENN